MRIPPATGRIVYKFMRPFLGLFFSGKLRTRALIIHKSQILLVRNWKGRQRWTLPGGGAKNNESSQGAIIRELKEELGLNVKKTELEFISEVNHVEGSAKYPVVIYRLKFVKKPTFSMHRPELIDAEWWQVNDLPVNIDELTEKTITQQR